MPRRFGPTRGAGVAVIEQSGDQPIEPGALGFAGHGGVYERGMVGTLIFALDKTAYKKQMGGRIPDSLAPDAALDFYSLANGAGGLVLVRVTDGTEEAANIPVYTRQLARVQLGTLHAKNGGRWGGKEQYRTGETPTDVATDITNTTIDTGLTLLTDEFAGGTLELAGLPNASFTIIGNDDQGVITIAADATMLDDLLAGADPANNRFYLSLDNGDRQLLVEFRDGEEDHTAEWGVFVYIDDGDGRSLVRAYANLSTNPLSTKYWVNVINNDSANYYVRAEDLYTGSHVAAARPANHWETFASLTATVLTANIHEFLINSPGGGNPTMALGTTSDDHLAQTITLTFSNATTFTAASDLFGALGGGTLGSLFTPNNKWTPPFTVTAGSSPLANTNTIVITYKPFKPDSLVGGYLYPDPDEDPRLKYRITANDHKTITVAAGSTMSTDVTVTSGVAATGSITFLPVADLVDGETFVLDDGQTPAITFHLNVGGSYTPVGGYDATNIEVDVSADTTGAQVAATARTAINGVASLGITAAVPVGAVLGLSADNTGDQANNAIIETVADADFVVSGMSGGVDASDNSFRVQAPVAMSGGKDGNADIVDADYNLQLWDVDDSPFNRTFGQNLGLVKFATPGVTSTAVQRAGVAYAAAKNHQYRYEVPENIVTEPAVDAYINETLGRSDYAVVSFPSRAYVADPEGGSGLKLVSLTGMIHGREAQIAVENDGYHKAEAGTTATLPAVLKLPTTEGDTDALLDEEFLNPKGINVIKKIKGNYVLWGDRTLWLTPEWKWKHQRELMSYYEHVLQESFDFIVFAINDSDTEKPALVSLQSFFLPEFTKRALRGASFTEAAIIKIDKENNTDATRAAGDMFADISLRLADTVERFIMRIGKQGIFESVA